MYALQQLPERFQSGPRSRALHEYIQRKYSRYGFRCSKSIEYNPEFQLTGSTDRYRWVEKAPNGLRFVGESHKIVKLNHTGWYNDNFQDETVHGEVWQLPARNGVPQYVPAVNDPCNDGCSCIAFSSITDDKEDAARWADSMAEYWAKDSREQQAKEDASQRLEEIADEIKGEYADFRRIVRELRASCDRVQGVAVVRELVKDRWHDTKAAILKLKREAKRIEDYGIEY